VVVRVGDCEPNTHKKTWKPHWRMQKPKDGALKSVAPMPGARSIARITTRSAAVVFTASPASGAPQKNPGNFAKALRRVVDNCTAHRKKLDQE